MAYYIPSLSPKIDKMSILETNPSESEEKYTDDSQIKKIDTPTITMGMIEANILKLSIPDEKKSISKLIITNSIEENNKAINALITRNKDITDQQNFKISENIANLIFNNLLQENKLTDFCIKEIKYLQIYDPISNTRKQASKYDIEIMLFNHIMCFISKKLDIIGHSLKIYKNSISVLTKALTDQKINDDEKCHLNKSIITIFECDDKITIQRKINELKSEYLLNDINLSIPEFINLIKDKLTVLLGMKNFSAGASILCSELKQLVPKLLDKELKNYPLQEFSHNTTLTLTNIICNNINKLIDDNINQFICEHNIKSVTQENLTIEYINQQLEYLINHLILYLNGKNLLNKKISNLYQHTEQYKIIPHLYIDNIAHISMDDNHQNTLDDIYHKRATVCVNIINESIPSIFDIMLNDFNEFPNRTIEHGQFYIKLINHSIQKNYFHFYALSMIHKVEQKEIPLNIINVDHINDINQSWYFIALSILINEKHITQHSIYTVKQSSALNHADKCIPYIVSRSRENTLLPLISISLLKILQSENTDEIELKFDNTITNIIKKLAISIENIDVNYISNIITIFKQALSSTNPKINIGILIDTYSYLYHFTIPKSIIKPTLKHKFQSLIKLKHKKKEESEIDKELSQIGAFIKNTPQSYLTNPKLQLALTALENSLNSDDKNIASKAESLLNTKIYGSILVKSLKVTHQSFIFSLDNLHLFHYLDTKQMTLEQFNKVLIDHINIEIKIIPYKHNMLITEVEKIKNNIPKIDQVKNFNLLASNLNLHLKEVTDFIKNTTI